MPAPCLPAILILLTCARILSVFWCMPHHPTSWTRAMVLLSGWLRWCRTYQNTFHHWTNILKCCNCKFWICIFFYFKAGPCGADQMPGPALRKSSCIYNPNRVIDHYACVRCGTGQLSSLQVHGVNEQDKMHFILLPMNQYIYTLIRKQHRLPAPVACPSGDLVTHWCMQRIQSSLWLLNLMFVLPSCYDPSGRRTAAWLQPVCPPGFYTTVSQRFM